MRRRSFVKLAVSSLALAMPASRVLAQAQSGRPCRLVVPLPAGTSNDYVARVLAPYMSSSLGLNVIVDNKVGGNGTVGTLEVLRSAPDGLTLLVGSNSPLAANLAFVRNLPYDPRRDLTPIAGASLTNHVLMVKSTFPARTFAEFLEYARQRPGRVSIGYSTVSVQLQIATINKMAGIELLPVPYRGTPATLTDILGGTLDSTLTDPGNALAQVRGGAMRALAVSSLQRNPVTPEWPAISETLPGFDFPSWNAFIGPLGIPTDVINRINGAVNQALRNPDVRERLAAHGTTPLIMTPDELKTFIEREAAKWVRLAREADIEPE